MQDIVLPLVPVSRISVVLDKDYEVAGFVDADAAHGGDAERVAKGLVIDGIIRSKHSGCLCWIELLAMII